jgi:hypothetical protein
MQLFRRGSLRYYFDGITGRQHGYFLAKQRDAMRQHHDAFRVGRKPASLVDMFLKILTDVSHVSLSRLQ